MQYTVSDVTSLLWREKTPMFALFAVLFLVGAAASLMLPKTYTARSSLLVQVGQEYVYQPRAGDVGRGSVPTIEDVVQSELEIIGSAELKRRVIEKVGLRVVSPKLASAAEGADAGKRAEIIAAAERVLTQGLAVHAPPKSGAVRLSFEHRNPESAALILNTLVSEYLEYRKQVFQDVTSPAVVQQQEAFENRLAEADQSLQQFLQANAIGDFAGEKAALTTLHANTLNERFQVEARLREAQGRLSGQRQGLAQTPSEVSLQRDIDMTGPTRLNQLRIDRQDLLARYRPDSQPVRDVDAKIAELEALLRSGGAVAEKDRRLGANPVWQDVEKNRIAAEAEVASLVARRNELQRQLTEITRRQLQLSELETEYQNLTVEREVLQANVRAFASRREEGRAASEIAAASADNIRVVERATVPARGESLRRFAFVGAFLFAAFTALCFGLFRVFTRKGFATTSSLERTLDLPVLASAPNKGR